jgi:hypothetical protein
MSGRATVEIQSARNATTVLLDEGIDQYQSMNCTYPQECLRALLQESEYKGIANARLRGILMHLDSSQALQGWRLP